MLHSNYFMTCYHISDIKTSAKIRNFFHTTSAFNPYVSWINDFTKTLLQEKYNEIDRWWKTRLCYTVHEVMEKWSDTQAENYTKMYLPTYKTLCNKINWQYFLVLYTNQDLGRIAQTILKSALN